MNVFIGTSGYDYPEWKGIFYPPELKRKDFLSYYAEQFNTLELNYSFYSMPTPEQMNGFVERSQGKVSFSVKANRLLTHEVGKGWKDAAREFKLSINQLMEKQVLGNILLQFPQSFHYIPENRIYLGQIIEEFNEYPLVVEFRHKDWIKNTVFEGLNQRKTGIVFCDMPNLKHLPGMLYGKESVTKFKQTESYFIGNNVYIRLHGRNAGAWYAKDDSPNGSSRYNYDYSLEELQEFVPVIQQAVGEGKKVFIYFNNHPNGNGALNAKTLKEMVYKQ